MENQNKKHWDEKGAKYNDVWANRAKRFMHSREMNFINVFSQNKSIKKVLDIGVGNGRILENYLKNKDIEALYGIDISDEMVKVCKDKFSGIERIKEVMMCNFAEENVLFDFKFDLISAIRVLKYNKNWKEMINKISLLLNDGGTAIFTMPNKYSLNIFGRYSIPFYRTSGGEMKEICKKNNLTLLDMQSFTRIPDFFYNISENRIYVNLIIFSEKILSKILGKYFFGRKFFIAVKK